MDSKYLKRIDTSDISDEMKTRLRDLIMFRIRETNSDYTDFDIIVREKARIDAELLLQVAHAMRDAMETSQPDRYVLVTSATVLRHLPSSALDLLDYRPEVLTLAEAAVLATILPDAPLPLRALQALLFDIGASEIHGLGKKIMRMLRRAAGASVAGASRGAIHMEIRSNLIASSKGTSLTPAQLEQKALRDPTLFAKLVASALDAYGLERKIDKVEILEQIKEIARHVGMEADDD